MFGSQPYFDYSDLNLIAADNLKEVILKVDEVLKSPKCWSIVAQISGLSEQEVGKALTGTLSGNSTESIANIQKVYYSLLQKVP